MSHIPGVYDIFNQEFERYATIWVMSDTHFNENDIKKAFPQRPSDDDLVKQINSICGKRDLVLLLGDVGDTSYLAKLRAKVWLILGNHDLGKTNYQRTTSKKRFDKQGFQRQEALDEMKRLYPNCRYSISEGYQFRSPFEYWDVTADNMLADQIFEGPVMLGEKILLSHEPVLAVPWCLDIHGHNHQGPQQSDCYHYNVALEVNDYKPTNLKQLMTSGLLSHIETLHRATIDGATARARKRGYTLKEKIK